MEMIKVIICQECSGRIEISGDVDESDGPDETDQKVTCPTCSEVNSVSWPRSQSEWVFFTVRSVNGDDVVN